MIDITQTYERPELSQLAIRYRNRQFIASEIFPWVDVPVDRITYPKFDRAVTFKRAVTQYGPRSGANELETKVTKTPHDLKHRGLGAWIDDDERRLAAGIMDVRAVKMETLLDGMYLDLEMLVAGTVFNAATYPTANKSTLAGATQWDNSGSNPKKAVLDAGAGMIKRPNTMIVGALVHNALLTHNLVLDAVKYTQGGLQVTNESLARYFGVERYFVGEAFSDSAQDGQTESLGYVWGKFAQLCYVNYQNANAMAMQSQPSFAYMPRSRQAPGGGVGSQFRVYSEAPRPSMGVGDGMEYLKVDGTFEPVYCATDLGYLFSAAVS